MKKLAFVLSCSLALTSSAFAVDAEYGLKAGAKSGKITRTFDVKCDTNLGFGDPAKGQRKICEINGKQVAGEGGVFRMTFTSHEAVEYGANAIVKANLAPATRYNCGVNTFGKDPLVGVVKSCYVDGHRVAGEGQSFVTPGPSCARTKISYGARSAFTSRDLCAGRRVKCNHKTFGDPLVGVVKHCEINGKTVAGHEQDFTVPGNGNCLCSGTPNNELNGRGPLQTTNGQ